MYSQAKERLQQEQSHPVTDKSLEQIRDVLKPEQALILSELIEKLNPIIKARHEEAQLKADLVADLSTLTVLVGGLVSRLDKWETVKSQNITQEQRVLDLLEVELRKY